MKIDINVTNGVHGQPAEGVCVSIEENGDGGQAHRTKGRTDENGLFRYTDDNSHNSSMAARCRACQVEIDVDSYFAALAMASAARKITIFLRVSDQEECKLGFLITPFMHSMYYVR